MSSSVRLGLQLLAVLAIVFLVGLGIWKASEPTQREAQATPSASTSARPKTLGLSVAHFESVIRQCETNLEVNEVPRGPRRMCRRTEGEPPFFVLELIGDPSDLLAVTVSITGRNAIEFIQGFVVASDTFTIASGGTKPTMFFPKDWMQRLATEDVSVVYEGRRYASKPVVELGLVIFTVEAA